MSTLVKEKTTYNEVLVRQALRKMLELSEDGREDDTTWQPILNRLLLPEKVVLLRSLCCVGAKKPVETLLRNYLFTKEEIKEVLRILLLKHGRKNHSTLTEYLLTQGILFTEKDYDMLLSCIKLNNTEILQQFLGCIPDLHIWHKNILEKLILTALELETCNSLQLLLMQITSPDEVKDSSLRKAICKKANFSDHKALSILLELSSSRCIRCPDKYLERSVQKAYTDTVKQLLVKGPDLPVQMKRQLGDLAVNNIDILQHVVEKKILAVDEMTSAGTTLLMQVCTNCNVEAAEFLLLHGASPNTFYKGSTLSLLHVMLLSGKTDIAELLLWQPDIDVTAVIDMKHMTREHEEFLNNIFSEANDAFMKYINNGYQAIQKIDSLDIALFKGYIDIAAKLWAIEPLLLSHVEDVGRLLPLHFCLIGQHIKHLNALCHMNPYHVSISVKIGDFSGTCLHMAVRGRNFEAVNLLLKHNALVNAKNDEGHTPIFELLRWPLNDMHEMNRMFDILLTYGASLDVIDDKGHTLEEIAIEERAFHVLRKLKLGGQSHHSVNWSSDLVRAAKCESFELLPAVIYLTSVIDDVLRIIENLLKRLDEMSYNRLCLITSLMMKKAGENMTTEIPPCEVLLENGFDANVIDKDGNNMLHFAADKMFPMQLNRKIVKNIKYIDARNKEGLSALHIACCKIPIDMSLVGLLLDKKCNPNLRILEPVRKYVQGDTVLHVAIRGTKRNLVETLLLYGANLWLKNVKGHSPNSACFGERFNSSLDNISIWDLVLKAGGYLPHLSLTARCFRGFIKLKDLVELLMNCGCTISIIDRVNLVNYFKGSNADNLLEFIDDFQKSPLSMRQLSANVVRRVLRPNAVYSVEHLPLPTSVKDVIVMKHIPCAKPELHQIFYNRDDYFDNPYDIYDDSDTSQELYSDIEPFDVFHHGWQSDDSDSDLYY